jgi:hypothetical protein
MLFDYAGRIVLVREVQGTADEGGIRKRFGDGLFHPGESRNEIFGVQPGLQNFEAVVDEIIKAALADPNDATPAATAATKIQERITVWKAQQHTTVDFEPGEVQGVVAELKAMSAHPNANKGDALQQCVARRAAPVAALSPHAELKRIGGLQ